MLPLFAGLALYFLPALTSGFARLPGTASDTRHIRFVLEWNHLCLTGAPVCSAWLSPPVFYPEREILPSSELLLGQVPIYSAFRIAGARPLVAQQLTIATFLAAGYAAAWWLLGSVWGFPAGAAALGSFLFAFAAPRSAQAEHPHLVAFFALPLALGALSRALAAGTPSRGRWWALAAAALVFQAYASLGLAWLAAVWLVLVFAVALALAPLRGDLAAIWRRDWRAILAAALAATLALAPLAALHAKARDRFGSSGAFSQVEPFLPRPASWLDTGGTAWEGAALRAAGWRPDPPFPWEHHLGIGLATTAFCIAGAWPRRREPWARALLGGSVLAVLVVTAWPGGFSLWRILHTVLPGAGAVRAVGRIVLVLLLPLAAGAAASWSELTRRSRFAPVLPALALLFVVEQGRATWSHRWRVVEGRVAALVRQVSADCTAFAYSVGGRGAMPTARHVDAMWAALATGIPTVNGWTSYVPPDWVPLFDVELAGADDIDRFREALDSWSVRHQLARGSVCWIRMSRGGPTVERRPALPAGEAP